MRSTEADLESRARDYRAAVEVVKTNCSVVALANLRMAEDALKAAACAKCYSCLGGRPNCQCNNDE